MKPTTLFTFLFFSLSVTAFAQSPNAARAVNATKQMSEKLSLSDEQFEQVNTAYLTMYRDMDSYKNDSNDRKEANASKKMSQLKENFNTTLSGILSSEQLSTWKSEETSSAKKMPRRESKASMEEKINNASTRKTARMAQQLELNEKQEQQVLQANIRQTTKLMELRALVSEDPQSIEIERRKIVNAYEATIYSILNSEQREKQKKVKAEQEARKTKIKYDQKNSKILNTSDNITKKADSQTKRMAKRLQLNETQEASYRSACIKKLRALEELKTTYGQKMSPEKTAASKEVQSEFDKALKTFLSPQQLDMMNSKSKN